ncbi:ester cyclase [Shimazuella alba]|uniref:Ester cyclase n=1 Tax=Shimazuella alba TaxID=2690964 RepID=A0A6I4VVP5_9BACL|nr:ester cyclase [Shimazuella alba]MXQ54678.1 ester cyclase [Shimazuella alba]
MNTTEQKNLEAVTAFLQDKVNENLLNETNQYFSQQVAEAFTNRKYEVDEIFVQGEKAIARIIISAVHTGGFAGNVPTNKPVKISQYRHFQVVDGKIVNHQGWFDTGTLLPQIQG